MTTAIGTHRPIKNNEAYEHDDFASAVASINALGRRGDGVLAELQPRWRPTEEEIVRAAITLILISLVALICLAAAAILTLH
ncbi:MULTISPECIES: hypothetical protein [unclassified Mycobacterium]|uniref:hypothetical protein n=1 Tax=unclassified Mycobacterium TaxID=2642494 RepID=UPI002740CF21|nr:MULTISPECIES: hypothetical protein [unclassified Mycobacterium]MDP7701703.1 hypothetical protein [Mycobacterium sp. TY815]MDP7724562.1 hypothetical protein [Mycobacterium sp. TY814]